MLIRLETRCGCRVTGLCFHRERSWVLAGHHDGVIELWDYYSGLLIDSFQGDHNGAVRAVHFHSSEPLFVSGGDDWEIKVWSYELHKDYFSLTGHRDCIRTVEFHHNEPWILSASYDKTVRIWNWKSCTCISVLKGHSHAVTCASFHPNQYLVVSASMDQTIRVWNIVSLKKKPQTFLDGDLDIQMHCFYGHDKVNWASFHATEPLIFSGGNDHKVKIWQMQVICPRPVGTLEGHMHSVSCVLFHARQNVIVSNSQDKTIRMWDPLKRTCLGTFCSKDRFWILASHPSNNFLGAGHDNGIIVFKLARERPAFYVSGDSLYYVKNEGLHVFDYLSQEDVRLTLLNPLDSDSLNKGWKTLSCNSTGDSILICSGMELNCYELYTLPEEITGRCKHFIHRESSRWGEGRRWGKCGGSSVFTARNRFVVLDKTSNQLFVKNLMNDTVKKIILPMATDAIFQAGNGKLLCGNEDRVIIFDLHQQNVLGDMQTSFIRYVVWSSDMESVALLSKYWIVIADKKLVPQCKFHEKNCVKSGTWDDNGVFVYTTQRHIKYCLSTGETGIIKTLGVPKYITKICGSTIFCLDRDGKICPVIVDSTEYMFKLSLLRKRYDEAMSIIRNSKLCGRAMIAYLQKKGFPEVALHFVKDERIRFTLALESGNFQMAVALAKEIDDKDYWNRLGTEALFQGKTGFAEYVYEKTKDFKRLSFLYLITGNLDKLLKVTKTFEVENGIMSQFHHALSLGDVEKRVKILENAGQYPLAYITALVHGLCDIAERLAVALADNVPALPKETSASLLIPPKPLLCGGDWSSLIVTPGLFERGPANFGKGSNVEHRDAEDADFSETSIVEEVDRAIAALNTRSSVFIAPTPGMPFSQIWVEDSFTVADHAAAGNFEAAMWMLSDRYRITKFTDFKSLFMDLYLGSQTFMCAFPSTPVISAVMNRHWNKLSNLDVDASFALVFNYSGLRNKFEAARGLFVDERFIEAFHLFQNVLHVMPLSVVESVKDLDYIMHLIYTTRNYLLVTKIQLKRRELKDNLVRQLELAAYSTHVTLNTCDSRHILFNAMTDCYEAGNRKTAAKLARRLLEANSTVDAQSEANENMRGTWELSYNFAKPFKFAAKFARRLLEANSTTNDQYSRAAEQVLQDSNKNTRDLWQMNYDFLKPFQICGATLNPIYEDQNAAVCSYCESYFVPSHKGQLCTVCEIAAVVDEDEATDLYTYPVKQSSWSEV